ncbi:hypothetical protein O4H49_19805 [Kiloniella laminariae]|uniref:Phosphotyrosine protein phosphatase I domain-containing protein n=1 Tax=Kiloniella laminariae TaxID=454162 RepID=A0ABT4LPI6_9PROT|nr:hypothetical protein [Kiloniella laminariae]MCZ4283039.1 hypothetical protein [Kiloniella laminariae]
MKSFPLHVLFLCDDNAIMSPMAEALLKDLGGKRVRAFSAGRRPADVVKSTALKLLRDRGYEGGELFPKSLQLFMEEGAPHVDLVVNLTCASDRLPVLGPVGALRVHWDFSFGLQKASGQRCGEPESLETEAAFLKLEGIIRQVLQPNWEDLTTRGVQRLFQVAGLASSNLVSV